MGHACLLGLLLLPLLLGIALNDATQMQSVNNAEVCLLPQDEGPCRALIPSYYYDRNTQNCSLFMYGGCEGNANNFETFEECTEACWKIEIVPKVCRLDVNEARCGESTNGYFFNLSSMRCEKYRSSGCQSNGNQFPDEATCLDFCLPKRRPSFCYSPKDGGLCSANVTRYYFNARNKECETFNYTGCGGNDNNFVTVMDCKEACANAMKKYKIKKRLRRFPKRRRNMKIKILKIKKKEKSS
ncbi:tissue factor pathway inhibitor 2-like [Sorex fumeus]|uniref:tissue factor pathway inhibitor 2-like n=1 Tax=Sorex fumeus TaxID=62283 RepID=UPI0024AD1D5D|nr:tissue factor pathway inhibitor 2-like [Sorex fumeus]